MTFSVFTFPQYIFFSQGPTDEIANRYADLILNSPKLEELCLYLGGAEKEIAKFLNLLLPRVSQSQTLAHLKLRIPSYSKGSISAFLPGIEALQRNSNLLSLELKNHSFSDEDSLGLGRAIDAHPSLEEIKLEDVPGFNRAAFFNCLKENKTLRRFVMPAARWQVGEISVDQFQCILSVLHTTSITHMSFQNWKLEDMHADLLIDFIQTNSELVQLNIASNDFTGEKFTEILGALMNHPNLKEANVKWNDIKTIDERLLIAFNNDFSRRKNEKDNTHDATWYEDPFFSYEFTALQSFTELTGNALYRTITSGKQDVDLSKSNLSDKEFIKLAGALAINQNLRSLNIGNNAIGDEGIKALIPIIKNSPALAEIDVSKNKITSKGFIFLFSAIGPNSNIRKINFSDNNIKTLSPSTNFNAQTLQILKLNSCQLESSKSNGAAIKKMMDHMPNLQELDLGGNKFEGNILRDILGSLKFNFHVTNINYSSGKFDHDSIRALSECFLFNITLSNISINLDGVSINELRRLIWARKYNRRSGMVQEFGKESSVFRKMEGNQERRLHEKTVYEENRMLGDKGVKDIKRKSNINSCAYNGRLDDVRNGRVGSLCQSGIKELQTYLPVFKEVKQSPPKDYRKSDKSFYLLYDMKLNQVKEVCNVLKNYPGFPSVAFFNNKIESETSCISEFLIGNESTRTLDMMWEDITDKGAITIAEGLSRNCTLEELDMSYNDISSKGAVALLRAALKHPTLKKLELHWNRIDDGCVLELIELIKDKNCQLKYIGLACNQFFEKSIQELEKVISGKKIEIEFFGNINPYLFEEQEIRRRKEEGQQNDHIDLQLGQLMLHRGGDGKRAFEYFAKARSSGLRLAETFCGLAESMMFTDEIKAQEYLQHIFQNGKPNLRSYLLYSDLLISDLLCNSTKKLIEKVKEDFSDIQEDALQFLDQSDPSHKAWRSKLSLLKYLMRLAKNPDDADARQRLGKWYKYLLYDYMLVFRKEALRGPSQYQDKKLTRNELSFKSEELPEQLEKEIVKRAIDCYKEAENCIDKVNNKLDFYEEIANLYFYNLESFQEARNYYVKVWELGKRNCNLAIKIALLHVELNERDEEAERYFKADVPQQEVVAITYGLFLQRVHPNRSEEALSLFQTAAESGSGSVHFNKLGIKLIPEEIKKILGLLSKKIVYYEFNLKYVSMLLIVHTHLLLNQKDKAAEMIEKLSQDVNFLQEKSTRLSNDQRTQRWDSAVGRVILAELYERIGEQDKARNERSLIHEEHRAYFSPQDERL